MTEAQRRECAKCRRLFAAKMAVCPFCGHRETPPAAAAGGGGAGAAPGPPRAAGPESFPAEAAELFPTLRLTGVVPNFSPASLAAIDLLLDEMWGGRDGAKRETDPAQWAPLIRQLGCYVGEVVRRTYGGHWTRNAKDPSRGQVVLPDGLVTDPFSHPTLRFEVGWSHDLASQFDVLRTLIAQRRAGQPPGGPVVLAAAADPAEAVQWNEQGDAFQLRGRPDLAMRFYDKVIELAPGSGAGWFGKGNCHGFLGRFAEALPCLDRAVELAPDFAEAWENRACVLMELDRLEAAERSLEKAVELAPQKASVFYNRGNLEARRGRRTEAMASYDHALRLDPKYRAAWVNKAGLLEGLGQLAEAVPCHDQAIALEPQDAQAWLAKARCLAGLERWEDALDSYATAVQRDATRPAGWYQKALLEERIGRKHDAVRSLRAFLDLNPADDAAAVADARQRLEALEGDPSRWEAEAGEQARAGRVEAAVAGYEKAVALDPTRATAWRERGVGLALLGRFEEALASFDRAIALEPENPTGWDHKAVALARMDRSDEALALIDHALSLDPERPSLLKHKGACLANLGRPDEAVAAYAAAVSRDPRMAEAWLLKSVVEERLGRVQDAVGSLRRFIEVAPPEMAQHVASARTRLAEVERGGAGDSGVAMARAPDRTQVSDVPDAQASYEKALAHVREDRFAEALPCFEYATRLDPRNATLWKDQGNCLADLGRDEDAIRCFEKSAEAARCSAGPYYSKAQAEERLGRRAEAGRSYQMFLVLDYPVRGEWAKQARRQLTEWGLPELDIRETGLLDEFMSAHVALARAVGGGASKDDAALWSALAEQFVVGDREDLGFHCLEKALAVDPRRVDAWFFTGTLLFERGRLEDALRRFERVVALGPRHALGWWHKLATEERLGRHQDMASSLRQYLAVAPPDQSDRIAKARALLKKLAPGE